MILQKLHNSSHKQCQFSRFDKKENKENISITDYNLLLLQSSNDEIQMSKLTVANTHSKETRYMQQYLTKRKHTLSRFHLKIH